MMIKKKTNLWARLEVLFALPLTLLAVSAFANPQFTDNAEKKPYLLYINGKESGTIDSVEVLRNGYGEIRLADIFNIMVISADMAKKMYKDTFDETKAKGAISIHTKKVKEETEKEIAFEDLVFYAPDTPAKFPGDIYAWLRQNIKYPKKAQKERIEGRVDVQFIIENDGSIVDAKVLRSPNELLSAEALRVVKSMPKWEPAQAEGNVRIRMRYVLPISFRLPPEKQKTN